MAVDQIWVSTTGDLGAEASYSPVAAATGVLTFTGIAVAGTKITIGTREYTWRVTPTLTDEVTIGADQAASEANFTTAINTGPQGGGAANTQVTAVDGAGTVTLTAITAGSAGNDIATTETMGSASFAAVTLTGGRGVPENLDTIFFDGSSNKSVITNLSALQQSAVGDELTRVWIQPPYSGNIGAEGNPFRASTKYLIHQGSGSLVHWAENPFASSYIVIDSPNQQNAYRLVDTDGAGGVALSLAVLNGHATLSYGSGATGIVLLELLVGGGNYSIAPSVTIGDIDAIITYRQTSGYVTTKRGLGGDYAGTAGRAVLDGGTLIYESTGTNGWGKVEITGGYMAYNGLGTMASCIVNSGTLDMTQDSRAKTITKLILMPGANFLTHSNITVTTLIDLRPDYPILP